MVFSQSTRKGTWSGRTTRSEHQRDWNSFAPATNIPRNLEGSIFSPTKETILRHETIETKKFIEKGETEGAFSFRQQLPQRRGRLRKNKEVTKALIPEGLRIGLVAKRLLRHIIQQEFVGKSS
jgi:hypothetical protein